MYHIPTDKPHSYLATCFQSPLLLSRGALSPIGGASLFAQLTQAATPTTAMAATEWLDASAPATTCAHALPPQLASHRPSNATSPLQTPEKNAGTPETLDAQALARACVRTLFLNGRGAFSLSSRRRLMLLLRGLINSIPAAKLETRDRSALPSAPASSPPWLWFPDAFGGIPAL